MKDYQNKISVWSKIYKGISAAFPFVLFSAVALIILVNLGPAVVAPPLSDELPLSVAAGLSSPFDEINLEAKAALAFDALENKIIYSLNSEEQLPLASLTKIMTAVITREILPDYTTITIDSDSIKKEGDSGLRVGEKWRGGGLLGFPLLGFSNRGAGFFA